MNSISLAGLWLLSLGNPEPSVQQAALPTLQFTQTIELPGTTATRGKGLPNHARERSGLTDEWNFEGAAWYQREIEIPQAWTERRIQLKLERTKYTQVWLDGRPITGATLFGTPQLRDLSSAATPGKHTLTVMVDNRSERQPVRAQAHQFRDGTQSNWNGLLGSLELTATDMVWLDDVQVYSDLATRSFRVRAKIGNLTKVPAEGTLTVSAASFNHSGESQHPAPRSVSFKIAGEGDTIEAILPLGDSARLWDEFSPALYKVTVKLEANSETAAKSGRRLTDERSIETGLREFRPKGTSMAINGRVTFLRGKQDACIFPLTGHPPMDVAGWEKYFRTVQAWGFNHVRCHTWVPPEAAFIAADRLGIYLQPELPFWGTFDVKARDALMPEAESLLREYGNHPSFVMMTLANEAGGDRKLMNDMVSHLRSLDPRHIYSDGSNNTLWDPIYQPTSEFFVSAKVKPPADPSRALPARGSFCVFDGDEGHTQWGPSDTLADITKALAGLPVPFVGHETGQWTSYPDFRQVAKYTGIMKPWNLEHFRENLAKNGLLDQALDFHRASGALAAELYREESELLLRSPGCGGYQLLDLQDNPEQGSALVGMLDAFMDSKGFVTPEEFRRSCSPIVPLARFDRYTWTTAETYSADLQLAHYGATDLLDTQTTWALVDASGQIAVRGAFPIASIAQGGLRSLGRVEASLAGLKAPARYDLEVTVASGHERILQRWPVWVFPAKLEVAVPDKVVLVRNFDAKTKQLLSEGKRVVLIPDGKVWANTLPGAYATDYWNWPMFNGTPGTMGLLCDPTHPALSQFPTSFHSERQWADIAHASTPVILTGTPGGLRPIVQVIDNFERNEKLGLVFEATVGQGRLLVCAVDLYATPLCNKPEARQLLASLLNYAASDSFAPKQVMETTQLDVFLRPSLAQGKTAAASSCFTPPWGFVPKPLHAFDGNLNTRWFPAEDDLKPSLSVDLGKPYALDTIELNWGGDAAIHRVLLESSTDGNSWSALSDQRENPIACQRQILNLRATGVRHIRVTISRGAVGEPCALREIRVLGE